MAKPLGKQGFMKEKPDVDKPFSRFNLFLDANRLISIGSTGLVRDALFALLSFLAFWKANHVFYVLVFDILAKLSNYYLG